MKRAVPTLFQNGEGWQTLRNVRTGEFLPRDFSVCSDFWVSGDNAEDPMHRETSICLVELVMTAAKIATAFVLVSMIGQCHAQEAMPLRPMANASAVVATQTSSPGNYALLQPIGSKPVTTGNAVRRQLGGILMPMMTGPAGVSKATTSSVVVVPHSFKQGIFDEHKFMVRNDGKQMLSSGKILLTAPAGSIIQQVSPKPDSVSGLNIELTVGKLAPGEHQFVEVAIKYPRDELAHFETKVVSQNWMNSGMGIASQVASGSMKMPTEPMNLVTESKNAATESSILASRENQMLQPQVPVLNVSASKRRMMKQVMDRDSRIVSMMLSPAQKEEANPQEEVVPQEEVIPMGPLDPLPQETVSTGQTQIGSPPLEEAAVWKATIEAAIHGPQEVEIAKEIEFAIDVTNSSAEVANSVIVQLAIPQQMKVTILDRAAWYDGESRKLSWELKDLGAGVTETIRYKAIVKTGCSIEQVVVTGSDSVFQCRSTMQTTAN